MAYRFADNPKYYNSNALALNGIWDGGTVLSITAGPTADDAMFKFDEYSNNLSKILDSQSTWIFHFLFYRTGTATKTILNILDNTTSQIYVEYNTTGVLVVKRGDGTVLATGTTILQASTYYHIQFKVVINNTTGSFGLKINNVLEVSGTNVDTQNSANATADRFYIGRVSSGDGGFYVYFGNLVVFDGTGTSNNDYGGELKVKVVYPDGAGNYSQFTPSTGSNYQNVDETPPNDDTDYNSEDTAGQKDSYTYEALGFTGSIKAVSIRPRWRKDDAGSRTAKTLIRISGTDYSGSDKTISNSYIYDIQNYETSPATAIAWTVSEIDGAEFGAELVA